MTPSFVNDNTLEFRLNDLRMSLAAWVACPVKNDRREQSLYVIPRPKAGTRAAAISNASGIPSRLRQMAATVRLFSTVRRIIL